MSARDLGPLHRRPGARLLAGAVVAAALLVAAYLALGGAAYQPTAVQDPCEPREWRDPRSVEEAADQFTLSALDGAACELQVTRERLALALVTEETREQFAGEHGIGDEELEAAVRAGFVRAIDDAERAGALPGFVAAPLRLAARQIPVEEAIALILDAEEIIGRGRDLLGRLEGLLR